LAKCCIAIKNNEAALQWIDGGIAIPVKGEDDEIAHADLVNLRNKHFKGK